MLNNLLPISQNMKKFLKN